MSSLDNTIKEIILKALPNLCKDTQEKLVSTLVTSGVESAEDLKYIQQEDIKDLLSVVQQRKLLETFKRETNTVALDLEITSSPSPALPFFRPSSASTSSLSSIPPISPQPSALHLVFCQNEQQNLSQPWTEDFQVPWNKMPLEIQTAISEVASLGLTQKGEQKLAMGRWYAKEQERPSNKKRQAVNVQVSTLIKNLMDFEWHFIQ